MGKTTYEFEDMHDALSTFEDCLSGIRGFAQLLDLALFQGGGDLQGDGSGIVRLLTQQTDILSEIHDHFGKEIRREKKPSVIEKREHLAAMIGAKGLSSEKALQTFFLQFFQDKMELERVSRLLGIDEETVQSVLFYTALPDITPPSDIIERKVEGGIEKQSDNLIADHEEGAVDAAAIARTLSLKTSTVERVIEQLQAGAKTMGAKAIGM